MNHLNNNDYQKIFSDIKQRIRSAQYEALKTVNKELISLYWDIGKIIVERQIEKSWGKSVVKKLSEDLCNEFPGIQGYSIQNLWYMRQMYLTYHGNQKLQPLVGEISWSKNLVILGGCKNDLEREFYIKTTRKMGWTKAMLIHQIQNKTYEKTLINQTNFDKTIPKNIRNQAKLAVKDEFTFDFLEMDREHKEHELEQAIILKMDHFLKGMGGHLAFIGSQYRLQVSDKEFFIDILLYHRHLKSLVALELKVGEFQPEYVGKMQFYLAVLDNTVKKVDENPSIGIIVCKTKDRTIVEYALKESKKPIGVSSYTIVPKLPENLRKELPSSEQIEKLLEKI